ncbi:hypothetical protein [Actibacterium lipolyticum]|uniref:DUF1538 domain-containing protein n=1 Tax=Actibacterium lipolyticum TaxID=1524263 RepID=A0A238JPB2_9RHOB|nr:hypothetical protein [Actibacterium lipolyticum]SMX32034.1 hypothetical protein COL8621_00689 [Actibacterium lipolyticum]
MIEIILGRFIVATQHFSLALIDLTPAILFALILPIFALKLVEFGEESQRLVAFELTFFSLIGVLIAYLTYLSLDTVLENLLPSLVVLLTFFFQLFGRTKSDANIPLGTRMTLVAGSLAVASFLLCSRYFNLLFGVGVLPARP